MENKYTEAYKEQSVMGWEQSGLSQTGWCKQEQLNRRTFSGWIKKYGNTSQKRPSQQPKPQATFVPIEIKSSGEIGRFHLTYPNGVELNCPIDIELSQLTELLCLLD
jgi:transposase-like protein